MTIKGVKSVAEYAIRRRLQGENFIMSNFTLTMNGNEGLLKDKSGETLRIRYDGDTKSVYIDE